ncbi:MAG TPA: DUF2437 domain-containing protein, partial [Desulfobacterales bacterium]|nr:DUF2437 domain-containing protein [Desulfobacterales bacterium]
MKFVRYQLKDRRIYGIWENDRVKEIKGSIFGEYETTGVVHNINEVRLLTPVEPSKILCVGLNYKDHIEEIGARRPELPSHFLKPQSAVIGPGDAIRYPKIAQQVDYEGEVAVVIKNRIKGAASGSRSTTPNCHPN